MLNFLRSQQTKETERIIGDLLSAINSLRLLILQTHSGPQSVSDNNRDETEEEMSVASPRCQSVSDYSWDGAEEMSMASPQCQSVSDYSWDGTEEEMSMASPRC